MADLNGFVREFKSRLAGVSRDDYLEKWGLRWVLGAVVSKFPLDEISLYLEDVFGHTETEAFYAGFQPQLSQARGHILGVLARRIDSFCIETIAGGISIDESALLAELTELQDAIRSGKVEYTITLHLTNIDVSEGFRLTDGTTFRKLSPEEVFQRYSISSPLFTPPPNTIQIWGSHCVEAVLFGTATPAELQKMATLTEQCLTGNSILHAFYISGIDFGLYPKISHLNVASCIESSSYLYGYGELLHQPRMLSADDVELYIDAHATLKTAETDRVLDIAIDRFVLGKKRSLHHPNRIYKPNWDKLVDYVIVMETLFLTMNGSPTSAELSYRLQVNGSLILRTCLPLDVRTIFDALKHLYSLRSKVVHGSAEADILKAANKFLRLVEHDVGDRNSLATLTMITKRVEGWLTILIKQLGKMPVNDRPYRKLNGWEDEVLTI